MASLRRRLSSVLSTLFPEKRLFIQTGDSTRYLRLTPLSQLASGTALLLAAGWMAIATATVAIDLIGPMRGETQAVVIQGAYQARLEQLAEERDRRTGEARSAQTRFQVAMKQISRQQTAILQSVEQRRELSTALDLMRQRLHDAVGQRDAVARANDRLLDQMNEVSATLNRRNSSGTDLSETLQTVSGALAEAAAARDVANTERTALTQQVAELETRMRVNTQRQDEMVDQLEQAVAMSFGPLEKMFKTANLDVDGLIATVRTGYSGEGGPLGAATVSTRSFDDPGISSRFDHLMLDLDRMNLLRIAASKVPFAVPLQSAFRFTSPFGYRHDPKGRGRRMHEGVDLAAPRGTPIFATADGVVVAAGPESGYGNVVRVQHEFGFETVYAHQSKIRVKVGQQVSRGEQIGDMGSTGRSTGSHLHYEVRVNGQPVNPMTYLEAAKDVF
jgi:murein DD-endopeptidase MepM/ murein hydrolase activator NlpD